MRRLGHWLFATCAALSLALAALVGWAWWRSGRAADDRVSVPWRGDRYAVISRDGRLMFTRPPAPATEPERRQRLDGLAAGLRNDQLAWEATVSLTGGVYLTNVTPHPLPGSPAAQLWFATMARTSADVERPLLRALSDPDRFAAAHVLLMRRTSGPAPRRSAIQPDADSEPGIGLPGGKPFVKRFNGLTVHLRVRDAVDRILPRASRRFECDATLDPAEIPELRYRWHRRLEAVVAVVPHREVVAGAMVLPGAWLGAGLARVVRGRRRLRLARLGMCPACGYDLRASAVRCPECGSATPIANAL